MRRQYPDYTAVLKLQAPETRRSPGLEEQPHHHHQVKKKLTIIPTLDRGVQSVYPTISSIDILFLAQEIHSKSCQCGYR